MTIVIVSGSTRLCRLAIIIGFSQIQCADVNNGCQYYKDAIEKIKPGHFSYTKVLFLHHKSFGEPALKSRLLSASGVPFAQNHQYERFVIVKIIIKFLSRAYVAVKFGF
jgi:hypothetical protein